MINQFIVNNLIGFIECERETNLIIQCDDNGVLNFLHVVVKFCVSCL